MRVSGSVRKQRRGGRGWAGARALALACAVAGVVALAGCGAPAGDGGDVAVWHLPAGWHEITPPDGRSVASYAVSPDVSGLIVACIGAPVNQTSASPMGPATLWRTRDGGAHWQALDVRGLSAGCAVTMPRGGQGAIFVENTLPPTGQQTVIASRDGGETWRTLHFTGDLPANLQYDSQQLIERGVMRDGRLYAVGMPGALGLTGQPGAPFAVSDDLGSTWTRIEPGNDPLEQRGYAPIALAADYRAPGGWYRLLAFNGDGSGNAAGGPPTLEHSADGGRTWRVVGTAGNASLLAGARITIIGWLATSPVAPARLCLGLEEVVPSTSSRGGYGPVADAVSGLVLPRAPHGLDGAHGPPPPTPLNDILAGSDDGGATWQEAIVAKHRDDYGRIAAPGVATDAQGACVAADESAGDVEAVLRQQLVEAEAGNPPRDAGKTLAHEVGVTVAQGAQA
ncbi:MAG TPA: sialidase family protein, partial [Ktedonobacterales bacterium]